MRNMVAAALLSLLSAGCGRALSSPLADAAASGDRELTTSLLRGGADPNARNANGLTPLICAARAGQVGTIRLLVEAGADPNLRGGINGWTPIMHAVHKNQSRSVEALLDLGADVNGGGPHHESALMMAAGYGQTEIVSLLLRLGADPRARSADGETALSLAVSGVPDIDRFTVGRCQTETVKVLLEAAPELVGEVNAWARAIARVGGCAKVLTLLDQHRSTGPRADPDNGQEQGHRLLKTPAPSGTMLMYDVPGSTS